MASVPETPAWEPGIYQLETTDPVLGGADGIDNLQAKQLANRTAYLKGAIEDLEELIEGVSGGTTNHGLLSNRDAADAHPMSAVLGLVAALNGKSESTHVHNASAITAGTLAADRLPLASSTARGVVQLVDDLQSLNTDRALTAAQGRSLRLMIENMSGGGGGTSDHGQLTNRGASDSHPMSAISGLADALAGKAGGSHTHSATQITSGVMSAERLPAATTVVPGIARLVNTLTSTSSSEALTAAQGRVLKNLIDGISGATASLGRYSGWLRIPTGAAPFLIQWRQVNVSSGTWVAWPVAFPSVGIAAFCSESSATATADRYLGMRNMSTYGAHVDAYNRINIDSIWTGSFTASILAIGY